MDRLSSDFLFHYKHDLSVLKLILQYGFRHSLWSESLPYRMSQQQNFMCCFCDILPSQAGAHRKCYGSYALALTKEWGIRNRVSPVRYIHQNSPGMTADYIALKAMMREATAGRADGIDGLLQRYLVECLMDDAKLLREGSVDKALAADPSVLNRLNDIVLAYNLFLNSLSEEGQLSFRIFLHSMFNHVIKLHNEVEVRDAFCRAYEGDFEHPTSGVFPAKILYDEREWRSVRSIEEKPDGSHIALFQNAVIAKFLPPEFNLKFQDDDVVFIIVETEEEKLSLKAFIDDTPCLVDATRSASKIRTFVELA